MGRFNGFASLAEDMLQRASEEYHKERARRQQLEQQRSHELHNYRPEQPSQHHSSSTAQGQAYAYGQTPQPPPLPPRQAATSHASHPTPQHYTNFSPSRGHQSGAYEPQPQLQPQPSYTPSTGTAGFLKDAQVLRRAADEQLRKEQEEANRIRKEYELQVNEGRREADRLRKEYEVQLEEAKRLQNEHHVQLEWLKGEAANQQRQLGRAQQAELHSTNARVAKLMMQTEEDMRRAHEMLRQDPARAQEMSDAAKLAEQQLQQGDQLRNRVTATTAVVDSEVRPSPRPEGERATGTTTTKNDADDDLVKQIQDLLIAPTSPPPNSIIPGQKDSLSLQNAEHARHKEMVETANALVPAPHVQLPGSANLPSEPSQTQSAPLPPPPTPEKSEASHEPTPASQRLTISETSQISSPPAAPSSVAPVAHLSGVTPVVECVRAPAKIDIDWFIHDAAPEFLICSRCFVDHVYETTLRGSFERRRYADFDKVPRACFFGCIRVKEDLWPLAVSIGSLDTMLEFMKSRPKLGHCPETSPQESRDWWVASDVPGFSICPACYEDDIFSGPFATRFRLEKLKAGYICDTGFWFVKRMYAMHSEKDDWKGFAGEVQDRLQIPICPKMQPTPGTERTWLVSKRGPEGFQICYACYGDYFYGTPNAAHFQHLIRDKEKTVCLMGQLSLLFPAQQAISKKDPELFWRCIEEVDRQPFCNPKGIQGASWFTLPNDPPGFGVCGACRAGMAVPCGWSQFLIPKQGVSSSDTLLCCFNTSHVRFGGFMRMLVQTLLLGSWNPLGDFAAAFANVPLCPRSSTKTPPNRRYWGWDNLHICEECYIAFAKGTALEPLFDMKGGVIDKSRLCDIYSPRMRSMYTDTCEGRMTLDELLSFAHQRRLIYIQTVPECERLRDQQLMMAMQAQMLGVQGTVYKSMGYSQDAVMGHSYTVGNSYVGHGYANNFLLDGAVYDKQSRELSSQVTSGSALLQVQMLEQRWRAVE
ncbi:Reticulocyte-binding protein [Paramyrothecium foliicola]|nr:Reticulocyte-binding protein [Paramyrothecium foliicola]